MSAPDPPERFTYDLARISPAWPDPSERLAEWSALFGHYLPRLRNFFGARVGDPDLVDEVVSHVVRRALLKLHEIGDAAATWRWMCRTGINHLADLARRQRAQARRDTAFACHLAAFEDDVVPADVVARVAERRSLSNASADGIGWAGEAAPDDDDGSLGGRIPIDRTTYEARLAALAPDDRRLLDLIEIEGRSHAEAAAILGLPSAAASRKRHSRACYFVREGVRAP